MCWEIADGRLNAAGGDNFKAGIELDFGWLLVVIHRTETSTKETAKLASSHQNGEKRERDKITLKKREERARRAASKQIQRGIDMSS